jgi:hypothetical protein
VVFLFAVPDADSGSYISAVSSLVRFARLTPDPLELPGTTDPALASVLGALHQACAEPPNPEPTG